MGIRGRYGDGSGLRQSWSSCGHAGNQHEFHVKSFYGDDEKQLLQDFANLLEEKFDNGRFALCGHNGKEFDFPFIARRIKLLSIMSTQ